MRSTVLPFACLLLATCPSATAGDGPTLTEPTIVLTGIVGPADKGTYQEHAFDVPPGVARLDVEFTHAHKGAGVELEVGLFDPERFRGTSRFSKERFYVAEHYATPSYVPGRIEPGRWRLSLGIPSIGAETHASWQAIVRMSAAGADAGLGAVLNTSPAWYVGDFHSHTLHSDAFGCHDPDRPTSLRGCQPWEVVEAARARGLDFLAITDHNTTSHHADLATIQASLDRLLLLRGQELTTFRGHANVYGTSTAIDFRLGFHGRSIVDVLDDVDREGAVLSVNHPGRETGDRCTGCGWDAPHTPWGRVAVMEVVNGSTIEGPTAGLPFWYARLNEGHRIAAIGGSDDHAARSARGRIGAPSTVVFAEALSERAILDGVRAGRAYIRTRGPDGPRLELTASAGGDEVPTGGVLQVAGPRRVTLRVHVTGAPGQSLEIVRNGEVIAALEVVGADARLAHAVTLGPGHWVHVRLRDAAGLTALSNPVYAR